MSATPDSTFADPQQIIAELQRANVELQRRLDESNAERDEALERETATAEVLGVINSSPSDLVPVFDAMLEKALRLCGAEFGMMNTFDGEHFHHAADRGVPAAYASYRRGRGPIIFGLGTAPTRLVEGENLVHGADLMATEPYQRGNPNTRALADLGGARSHLCVALRKGDILLGDIVIYRQEVRPFTDKQIAVLQNFAAQAVIAMENARLITETQEALEQQTATADVLGVINSSPGDLAPVFDAILEKAHSLCGVAFGFLQLYDSGKLRAVAVRGVPDSVAAVLRQPIEPTPGLPPARLLDGERIVQEADMAALVADGRGGPRAESIIENGVRTALFVPLRKDANFLGCIAAFRKEVQPFSNNEIALLENFATQAVIAMENARLITETREALEQQTATAEVLQVINSSPGELEPVFDTVLERATRLCDAAFGTVSTVTEEGYINHRSYSGPSEIVEFFKSRPINRPGPGTTMDRLVRGESCVQVPDLMATDAYRQGDPVRRAMVDVAGARTFISVALRKDSALLGTLSVYRQEVRPFTDKQIALLQNFAAQAVIAMENARLITETREALEQQTATAEVLSVINSSPGDLAPVFDAILEKAHSLCGAAQGALVTYDGEHFRAVATRGLSEAFATLLREPQYNPPGSPSQRLVLGERFVHIDDFRSLLGPIPRAAAELEGARTVLFVPLRKDGALLGYITAYRQEVQPFTDQQIALLQNFAAQAVIAMENARLITETREALEQQTATAEVLQVINSSPGNLAPVFDGILEKAHRLCGITFGSLQLSENGKFRAVAVRGVADSLAELLREPVQPMPGTPAARLADGEAFVQVEDVAEVARAYPEHRRANASAAHGLHTVLFVPLRKDTNLLGYITGYREEVRLFSEKEIALLQNFAAQAVIAMENARLITETREALEQQTATAEVLQVINSSPGDLTPVFQAVLEKALRLCEAEFGLLTRIEGANFTVLALHGAPPAFAAAMREPQQIVPGQAHHRLMEGADVVQVEDIIEEDVYRSGNPARRALADLAGARTGLCVALRKDDVVLGAIIIYRQEVQPFSDKQVALLQNFAAQAVIAMENARLITETREALEQQTATAEVLGVINSSPGDLAPVFDAILEKAIRLCDVAYGSLQLYEGEKFRAVAVHGLPEPLAEQLRQGYSPGPHNLLTGEPFAHVLDLAALDDPMARNVVELSGLRTLLRVALRKDDVLLGQIVAARTEVRPFTDKQIALLQSFAAQAVIAMENARLITETREALEQQTATAEVLRVINASPGDLAPVFDAILEKAHALCGVASGALQLYDGEKFRAVATNGLPEPLAEWLRDGWPPGSSQQRVVAGEADVIHIADLAASDSPRARYVAEIGGVRTLLYVALRKDQKLLGVISASRFEVRPFSEKEIALLQNFAAQAVIAIENARLLGELRQRTDEVGELNRDLEARVAEQVDELGRVGRLKRFLAPQLAELIVSQGDEKILESHRREIVVVFCDLRGYTAFTETAEPEEVLEFLRQYHGALGPLVSQFEGTLDQFSGDGIMVFFNDPVPCPDPAERAVNMAVAMRGAARELIAAWSRHGCELGFGAGIAQGFATLGQIGFSERSGYTAIGTVCNLAARLCAEAKDGQILISSRIAEAVEAGARLEDLGNLELKGLRRPVAAYNVVQGTSPAEARPNLTVVSRDTGA